MKIIEIILDGPPGVGKTTQIHSMQNQLCHYLKQKDKENTIVLVNGALPEHKKDELVLKVPTNDISFIQKRYDVNHCLKWSNIRDVMNIYRECRADEESSLQFMRSTFHPEANVINIKERDGPASAVIFNWTSYQDLVLNNMCRTNGENLLSWESVETETINAIREWVQRRAEDGIIKHFLYLRAPPKLVLQRVKERNRKYESEWFNHQLSVSLVNTYDDFYELSSCKSIQPDHTFKNIYPNMCITKAIFDVESEFFCRDILRHLEKIVDTAV